MMSSTHDPAPADNADNMNSQQLDGEDSKPAGGGVVVDPDDRHAWQLRHRDRLPWQVIAEQFEETQAFVKFRVRRYIAATDAAARDAQQTLF